MIYCDTCGEPKSVFYNPITEEFYYNCYRNCPENEETDVQTPS